MAKGSKAKEDIAKILMEIFPQSFIKDKNLIIQWIEDGSPVSIKIAMTCAKDVISADGAEIANNNPVNVPLQLSEEDKQRVAAYLELLRTTGRIS